MTLLRIHKSRHIYIFGNFEYASLLAEWIIILKYIFYNIYTWMNRYIDVWNERGREKRGKIKNINKYLHINWNIVKSRRINLWILNYFHILQIWSVNLFSRHLAVIILSSHYQYFYSLAVSNYVSLESVSFASVLFLFLCRNGYISCMSS